MHCHKASHPGPDIRLHRITVVEEAREYIERSKQKSRKTFIGYRTAVNLFVQSCKKTYLDEIGRDDMLDYLAFLRNSDSSKTGRRLIPLNDGEIYNRDKYHAGLDAVGRAYSERGFIDTTVTSNMEFDQVNQTVAIVIDVNEGSQYRWRDVHVIGLDPKAEALLRARLTPGSPVNPKLIRDFYEEYKSLLPVGASPETVKWESDAQHAIVDLTFDFATPTSAPVHN